MVVGCCAGQSISKGFGAGCFYTKNAQPMSWLARLHRLQEGPAHAVG